MTRSVPNCHLSPTTFPELKCSTQLLCGITGMKSLAPTFCNYLSTHNKIWHLVENIQRGNKNIKYTLNKKTINEGRDGSKVNKLSFQKAQVWFSALSW